MVVFNTPSPLSKISWVNRLHLAKTAQIAAKSLSDSSFNPLLQQLLLSITYSRCRTGESARLVAASASRTPLYACLHPSGDPLEAVIQN
ncbi:rho guanine nucleotide exchange factor 10-like protein isoform X1 [Tachysurus ichikawai]